MRREKLNHENVIQLCLYGGIREKPQSKCEQIIKRKDSWLIKYDIDHLRKDKGGEVKHIGVQTF